LRSGLQWLDNKTS